MPRWRSPIAATCWKTAASPLEGPAAELLANPAVQDAYLGGQGGHYAIEDRIRSTKLAMLGR